MPLELTADNKTWGSSSVVVDLLFRDEYSANDHNPARFKMQASEIYWHVILVSEIYNLVTESGNHLLSTDAMELCLYHFMYDVIYNFVFQVGEEVENIFE